MSKEIAQLHCITQERDDLSHIDFVRAACESGLRWIQLRVKDKQYRPWRDIAQQAQDICKKHDAVFIVNDNVDLAREIDADGVHLGKEDMCPELARIMLGPDKIIGVTANTETDIIKLRRFDIDYIGLGPYRFTTTKEKLAPVLGDEGIQAGLKAAGNIPVIAVGGIRPGDIHQLRDLGVWGVALSSGFLDCCQEEREKLNEQARI